MCTSVYIWSIYSVCICYYALYYAYTHAMFPIMRTLSPHGGCVCAYGVVCTCIKNSVHYVCMRMGWCVCVCMHHLAGLDVLVVLLRITV